MPFEKDGMMVATVDDVTEITRETNVTVLEDVKGTNVEHLFFEINGVQVRRVIELWESLKKSEEKEVKSHE